MAGEEGPKPDHVSEEDEEEEGDEDEEEDEEEEEEADEGEELSEEESDEEITSAQQPAEMTTKLVIKDESEYTLDKDYALKVQERREQMKQGRKWENSDEELPPTDTAEQDKPEELPLEKWTPERKIKEALGKQFKRDPKVKYARNQMKGKAAPRDL